MTLDEAILKRRSIRSYDMEELEPEISVYRELALIKVRANEEQRQGVILLTNTFRGNIIDVAVDSLIIEMTGGQAKIDAFLNLLSGYEILELARTGIAGLGRGSGNVTYLN